MLHRLYYQQDVRSLVQIYADPIQRLVSDCLLLNLDTIVASDKMGNISILSSKNDVEGIIVFFLIGSEFFYKLKIKQNYRFLELNLL